MHSTGLKDERPPLDHTPFDMGVRSTGAQPDLLCTSERTMSEGKGKENGEDLSVNESVSMSEEQAASAAVDSSFIESSVGDDEGVLTGQINEGANGSTR